MIIILQSNRNTKEFLQENPVYTTSLVWTMDRKWMVCLSSHFNQRRPVKIHLLCITLCFSLLWKSDGMNFLLALKVLTAFALWAINMWNNVEELYQLSRYSLYPFPKRSVVSIRLMMAFCEAGIYLLFCQCTAERCRSTQHKLYQSWRAYRLWGRTLHL